MNICAHLKSILLFLRSEVNAERELGDDKHLMLAHLALIKAEVLDKLQSTFKRQPDDARKRVARGGPVFMEGWDMDKQWDEQFLPSREEVLEWMELRVKKVIGAAAGSLNRMHTHGKRLSQSPPACVLGIPSWA